MLALLAIQDWEAEPSGSTGTGRLSMALLAGYLLVHGAFLLRAWLQRARYRATDVLGETELARVHAELAAVERRTVGEILPVVLERSDRHPAASWLAALCAGLLGTAALAPWLPWDQPALVLGAELALGALGYASARFLPGFQRLFVSSARAGEVTEEQAFQEFHRHELERTEARTGVLLFVSLLEHRSLVLADEGIAARVPTETWARTNEALLAGIRAGSLADGLVAGIRAAGDVLAEHFPVAPGDRNEVPDRVVVRRE